MVAFKTNTGVMGPATAAGITQATAFAHAGGCAFQAHLASQGPTRENKGAAFNI